MREWAASGRVKIERANEHIRHLQSEFGDFADRRPYILGPEIDSDPRMRAHIHMFPVVELESVPPRWSAVVADAVHNLHTALDHMWQCVTGPRRHNPFPVFASPDEAKALERRKINGRSHPAIDLLLSVDPFEVGNPFWCIREFDNADKHDTLSLVAIDMGALEIDAARMRGRPIPSTWSYLPRDPNFARSNIPMLEHGAVFAAHPRVEDLDVDVYLTPLIAFGKGGPISGKPVIPTIEHFTKSVDALASVFVNAGLLK